MGQGGRSRGQRAACSEVASPFLTPSPNTHTRTHTRAHAAETSHSSVYATGDATSPPGLLALHYAKFNLNGAPWGAAVVDGYKGVVAMMGMSGAYAGLNVTVAGGSGTRVVLAGNQGWVNTTTLDVSGGALAASFLNLCVAQCLPSQYFNPPQSLYPGAMADITAAVDATRRLGALDVALNFPWLSSA